MESAEKITLREIKEEDHEFIFNIHKQALEPTIQEIWGWNEEWQRKKFFRDASKFQRLKMIQQDGNEIGVFDVQEFDAQEENHLLYIEYIALLPQYQGKGIGSQLIQGVLDEAKAKKIPVVLDALKKNIPAFHLYQKLGFKVVATDEHYFKMKAEPFLGSQEYSFRCAVKQDVPRIVEMLSDDPLGQKREDYRDPLPESYYQAFQAIDHDPNNQLFVCCFEEKVIGMLQLTFIPYLTYQGRWRALIEGVRIDSEFRSKGIGKKLFEWAIDRSKEKKCHLLQLTSDKARPDAIRFYEKLGFQASHEGMKLHFPD